MVSDAFRSARFLALVWLLGAASRVGGQASIGIQPEVATTTPGQPCSVNVVIDNVSNLGAFQFDMLFSPAVVHAKEATVGPFLGSTGRTVVPVGPHIDNTSMPARVTFGAATFGSAPGPTGSGVLATIVFSPQAEGSTALMVENVQVADINGQALAIAKVIWGRIVVGTPRLVTTTADSGAGSLRTAIEYANSHQGSDTIRFNIPLADPGCDSAGVCTIRPTSPFSLVDSFTVIDGYTQPGAVSNTNPFGAPINARLKIVLDGSLMSNPYAAALMISSAHNAIRGLVICNSSRGIEMVGEATRGNRIEGNFIGTDAEGTADCGNRITGVTIAGADNLVGGLTPEARNLISGNDRCGLDLGPTGGNRIQGNYIGTDRSGLSPLGNGDGIYIFNVSQKNLVGGQDEGAANLIAFNQEAGVSIVGTWGQAWWNTISRNRMHGNGTKGINLQDGGNQELASPVILSVTAAEVVGTAAPLATIEVFSDQDGQGAIYEGTTTADASGSWVFSKPEGLTGLYVTATATDTNGNTSEFSAPVRLEVDVEEKIGSTPTAFVLHSAYPNPFNGETKILYQLPKSFHITLEIYNLLGQRICTLVNEKQPAGYYSILWEGRDDTGRPVPSGVYVCHLKAEYIQETQKIVLMR
ncbi:MAG: T9SS type A sorting domain-containing protein [Candidatus Oleimicrobiaceae bacterium]